MADTRDEVYAFIVDFKEENGIPPTRREIAAGLGLGVSTVQYHIDQLVSGGMVTKLDGKSRGILPTED